MNRDKHWNDVLNHAKKHGFVLQDFGGVATLATHKIQNEHFTSRKRAETQELNRFYADGEETDQSNKKDFKN